MRVFLDFEASSLGNTSYPIEVAWVFEDGRSEVHLISPAPGWDDWADDAEAIHHISRGTLHSSGTPHDEVARRMIEQLSGHDLLASAPSWDGKWLSVLLRGAGLPRHALRLRDSDDECRSAAEAILRPVVPIAQLKAAIRMAISEADERPADRSRAHRAHADAIDERAHWLAVRSAAIRIAAETPRVEGSDATAAGHPVTSDGRYFIVRGRLWRMSDPGLSPERRKTHVAELMRARRAVAIARRAGDAGAEADAHQAVDRAETALGERGPVWWSDGQPDLNRHMARTGPYAEWHDGLENGVLPIHDDGHGD